MFKDSKTIKGGCYLEFQFCEIKNPIINNKVNDNNIEHWKDTSLLITDDDWNIFYEKYGKIFECALFPNGEVGFYPYGINYYDKINTQKILIQLKKEIDHKYKILIQWLELAVEKYNGFYILGV